ncbi:hypothetical protein EDC01DRAFT_664913 [Geopyxis carbonaria]|nr:hypothetical protein EDC01DRAFT_664913 [Geopyxis carbonaria]
MRNFIHKSINMENRSAQSNGQNLEDRLRGLIITNQQNSPARPVEKTQSGCRAVDQHPQIAFGTLPQSDLVKLRGSFSPASVPTLSVPFLAKPQSSNSNPAISGSNTHKDEATPPRCDISNTVNNSSNRRRGSMRGNYRSQNQYFNHANISAPPTASLTHFPPLGVNHSWENSTAPTKSQEQHTDTNRSHRRGESHQVMHSTHRMPYDHLHAEHALHIDRFAKSIIGQIRSPHSEIQSKNELLRKLEVICRDIDPDAALIPFGSFVTGFATASSDLDCVFLAGPENPSQKAVNEKRKLTDLPAKLAERLQQEGFDANLLSRTRVPIIKLVQTLSTEPPLELQCDIGFQNHLGIYNTQLLCNYSRCDPRLKDMVLFVKWWTKKRHINSPYRGTLSSYGYVLMIIHYLVNVVNPPVLRNLQLFPIPVNVKPREVQLEIDNCCYNVWFYKGMPPPSKNTECLGELLRGFFEYYAYRFSWGTSVISVRTKGGILTKSQKDWVAAVTRPGGDERTGETWEVKDRYVDLVNIERVTEHLSDIFLP